MQLLEHFELQFRQSEEQLRKKVREECQQDLFEHMEQRINQIGISCPSQPNPPSQLDYFTSILALLQTTKQKHQITIQELRAAHTVQLQETKKQYEQAVDTIIENHQQQLSSLKASYKSELCLHNEQHCNNSNIILQQEQHLATLNMHISNLLEENAINKQHYEQLILSLQDRICLQSSQINELRQQNNKYKQQVREIEETLQSLSLSMQYCKFKAKLMEAYGLFDEKWRQQVIRERIVTQVVQNALTIKVQDISLPQFSYQNQEPHECADISDLAAILRILQQNLSTSITNHKQSYVKAIKLLQNTVESMEFEIREMRDKNKKIVEHEQTIQSLKNQMSSMSNRLTNYQKDKKYLDEVLKQNLKLKEQAKNLEDCVEFLKIQKNSLMQNLALIGQMSAREQKQKNIVEQVVQRNYEIKVRNKELQTEIEALRNKVTQKQQELSTIQDSLKQLELLVKSKTESAAEVVRLQEELKSKQSHIAIVNDKIQELQRKLELLESLQQKITDLEGQLDQQTELISALREEVQQLTEQKQQIGKQKEALEAQNRILKHTQAIIKENQEYMKDYAIENVKLKESLQQSQGIICYLEEENRILKSKFEEKDNISRKHIATETDEPLKVKSIENLEETLKNNKENQLSSKDKEKYTKSILNLNELINFMMNYAKGYTFNEEIHIRQNSWIHRQGSLYVRKMSNQANIESKIRNYLKVRQIIQDDPRVKEVYDTYVDILNSYFTHLRYL